jgi:hypothetical protein
VPVLPDGSYDAIVVDATRDGPAVHIELTIIAGERKGEVVTVAATGIDRDELDLLGVPATIAVRDGAPDVRLEG